MLQTVEQPYSCARKFKPVWKSSNCCTVKPHHTRSNSLHNSLCCASCLIVYGALYTLRPSEAGLVFRTILSTLSPRSSRGSPPT